jgi:hypothetical protein
MTGASDVGSTKMDKRPSIDEGVDSTLAPPYDDADGLR